MAGNGSGSKGAGKSVVVAYICWLFGGMFGLHLFYLRRDAQGFLTWSTLGGYGLGWLADITKIPRYVKEVNEDPELMREIYRKMREHRKFFSLIIQICFHYTFEEYGDMIMCYGEARSNSYEAQRIYRERYPLRQVPNVRTFIDVHRRLREDGCFRKPKLNSGVSRTRRTVRNEETVLRMVENNPRTSTRKTSSAPPFSISRFISAIMIGYLWGQLVMIAIPESPIANYDLTFLHWLIPLGCSIGVWVVGNIGRETGKPWIAIGSAYLAYLSRYLYYDESVWFSLMLVTCALAFDTFSKEWRPHKKEERSFMMRMVIITLCGLLYISLWGCYFYFNGKITDSNGDTVPFHEAVHHFYITLVDRSQTVSLRYLCLRSTPWYEVYKQIIDLSDVTGEQNAYKVLGLGPTASQSEITARWRSLSREFHPDKIKDPAKQREAQERFMEIQQAYEILSNIKTKRKRKNKQSVRD
ncbi:dnaj subfamily c member 22 [Holotrichia oblita]|uniref:Dnaj subfamily c member 22 n=1 Tax=Holotrichia oblita TaxID=644536 RepID=A0ACB9TSC0_HOLOL|nr:dnaj subfamily c member 22 [Holotrichia oblita]